MSNNPVKYQKWFFDNRINRPGHWAGVLVYKHYEMWNIKKRYYKTPFFFLSYSPWDVNIGICVGKTAYTVQYHHFKPMWGGIKKRNSKTLNSKTMSDLRINIRLLMWHFKVTGNWKMKVTYNKAHKGLKYGWFDIYEWRPLKK